MVVIIYQILLLLVFLMYTALGVNWFITKLRQLIIDYRKKQVTEKEVICFTIGGSLFVAFLEIILGVVLILAQKG